MASFLGTASAAGTIYLTIGRSSSSPTASNTTNLADRSSYLTNSISGNGLAMWRALYASSFFSAYASVVDTPGIGTWYYSVWYLNSTSNIISTAAELCNLTILRVLS